MIRTIILSVCIGLVALGSVSASNGKLRLDLAGKYWHQIAPTRHLGFGLPLTWNTKKKFELRIYKPDFTKYIVTIVEVSSSGKDREDVVISAVDFSDLNKDSFPEQDCFYKNIPSCDGRLCDGLLIGIIDQKVISKNNIYVPSEVWKITSDTLKFEKVSTENVICKPQNYAQ